MTKECLNQRGTYLTQSLLGVKKRRIKGGEQWWESEQGLKGKEGGKRGKGEAFLLTVGAFFLTVELLCLQSLKARIRRAFPL